MTARLFSGGRLLRPDPAPAAVDALAVADGHIVRGRYRRGSAAPRCPPTPRWCISTRAVLAPGFVDAHLHPMVMSVFEQQLVLDSGDLARRGARRGSRPGTRHRRRPGRDRLPARRRPPDRTPPAHRSRARGRGRARPQRGADASRRPPRGRLRSGARARWASTGRAPSSRAAHVEFDATGVPTGLVRERAVEPLLGLLRRRHHGRPRRRRCLAGPSGCCARASPRSPRCARPPPKGPPAVPARSRPWAGRRSSTSCRSTSRPS